MKNYILYACAFVAFLIGFLGKANAQKNTYITYDLSKRSDVPVLVDTITAFWDSLHKEFHTTIYWKVQKIKQDRTVGFTIACEAGYGKKWKEFFTSQPLNDTVGVLEYIVSLEQKPTFVAVVPKYKDGSSKNWDSYMFYQVMLMEEFKF